MSEHRPRETALTTLQQRVLDCIAKTMREDGRPPTLKELCRRFRWKSDNSARQHLRLLSQKGALLRDGRLARGIRIPGLDVARTPLREVPLVGRVAAGAPIEAIQNLDGMLGVDPALFPEERIFALKVKGDSMIDAGIHEGDIALVQSDAAPAEGAIVVAILDGEATVKEYRRQGADVVLHPANAALPDLVIPAARTADLQIAGVVIGILRRM